MSNPLHLDATGQAALITSGSLTPQELADAAFRGLDAVDPTLRAVVRRLDARPPADGPFRGVPFVVKDMDGTLAGVPCTMSSRFLEHHVPTTTSEALRRLIAAGLVPLAVTSCPELGILGVTEPELRGPTHNPWSTAHTPGGSSGGSAALVAARVVAVGHGGDGGGSLRIPASACGLVGLKASRGRIPLAPAGEGWGGLAHPGVMTRSVRDTAALLDVLAGPAPGDPYAAPTADERFADAAARPPGRLRIAVSTASIYGHATHPSCAAAVERTARLLADLGHEVEEAAPTLDRDRLVRAYLLHVAAGVSSTIVAAGETLGRRPTPAGFEPGTWFLHQLGQALPAAELMSARETQHAAARTLAAFFGRYDLWLTPTLAHPPSRIGEMALKPAERAGLAVLRAIPARKALETVLADLADKSLERTPNTMLFNQTGTPAISLPLHEADGLPIGVQLAAAYGAEGMLLSVATQLEAAAPWIDRRPAVCA